MKLSSCTLFLMLASAVQADRELTSSKFWCFPFFGCNSETTWRVTVTNLTWRQPLGPVFVAVHDDTVPAVFQVGGTAGDGLEDLAEGGSPATLVSEYMDLDGVSSAVGEGGSGPIGIDMAAGVSRSFEVTTNSDFPYVSMAAMLINTNDCFGGFNNIVPSDGLMVYSPGYDSGTEPNDELCDNMPGPACDGFAREGTNLMEDGEGIIHIHRGFHGIGDLAVERYDWRNPVMKVEFERV